MTLHLSQFHGPVMPDQSESLPNQIERIFHLMKDGTFRSLDEIHRITGDSTASISAQLRNLKKERFGRHTLNKVYCGEGLWKYQIKVNINITSEKQLELFM